MIFSFNYHPNKHKKPASSVKIVTDDASLRERAQRVLENYAKDCKEFREDCIKTYGVPSPDLLSDPDYKDSGEEKNCIELSCDKSSEKFSKDMICSETDAVFLALLFLYRSLRN